MANLATDIKLVNNDFYINPQTNDFDIVFSDQQHVQDIINASPGHYKEFPLLGVDSRSYVAASGKIQELKRSIKLQLESDGYRIDEIIVNDISNLSVLAERI